jgi:hypothetical protein
MTDIRDLAGLDTIYPRYPWEQAAPLAIRILTRLDAEDLIPILGLDHPDTDPH